MSEVRNTQTARSPAIPDKLYFRIGEVARLLGVETHTLRFWETEFPQLKVGKGGTGQRLYRRRDVELVVEIKDLLYAQGYTIPGARQFLQARGRLRVATPAAAKPETDREVPRPERKGTAREPGLERIRDELRNLSALLNKPAAQGAGALRERKAHTPRNGLHITPATSGKSASQDKPRTLFDPEAE